MKEYEITKFEDILDIPEHRLADFWDDLPELIETARNLRAEGMTLNRIFWKDGAGLADEIIVLDAQETRH